MSSRAHLCTRMEESASRFPERLAVADADGGVLTYSELNRVADAIGGYLVEQGIVAGDRVGLVLPKSVMAYALLFGIMKARAAYVPVDWTNPPERIAQILTNCQVRLVFADARKALIEGVDASIVPVDKASFESLAAHAPLVSNAAERTADDLAYILHTSGSSGIPKGAMLTQENVVSFVAWGADSFDVTEEDRFGNHAPIHFAISVFDLFVPILRGASVHLVPTDLGKDPKGLARFIAQSRLTVWYSTPAILRLLSDLGDMPQLDMTSLRLVLFAGEPFQIPALRRLAELLPNVELYNLWGSTETNACTSMQIPRPIPESRLEPYPIGQVGSHCKALLMDEAGLPAAAGQEGLLHLSGPPVFRGYWEKDESNFVLRDGIRWHNTGDVVRESPDEGLVYVGRRDRRVKRHGYRIELAEVERGLLRHPAIAEAAVIALPDRTAGCKVIAVLVAKTEMAPSIIELKTHCNANLPNYMNPDVFTYLPALPRTSSNKVDYQSLIRKSQAEFGTP